jgi:formaldehyde-activating enzyme involved in methanogenesis
MGEMPVMLIGESVIGDGAEAAHLDTVLGRPDEPAGPDAGSAVGR